MTRTSAAGRLPHRFQLVLALGALAVALLACPADPPDDPPDGDPVAAPTPTPEEPPEPSPRPYTPLPDDLTLDRELVVEGLEQVVDLAVAPGDDRLYALEKEGRVWIVADGTVLPDPFLDIRDDVLAGGLRAEQGALSVAFHPDFEDNGRLFVYYVTAGDDDTRLEEFRVSDDPDRADPESRRTVLDVEQPFRWHNGGAILFGRDGLLWLSLGDGGVSGDPDRHAQDPTNLLGTIVRIDVDTDDPYAIPPDNPFADGADGAPEVWAYGLRNPWRVDLDPVEGRVYIADVGQHRFEWVNVVADVDQGHNFGWPIVEGEVCYEEHEELCPGEGLTDPVLTYPHVEGSCAIIGGIVYDGVAIPELAGHYLYTDFCGGWLRSFRYHDDEVHDERDWTEQVRRFELPTTFGRDADGEPLVADSEGTIWRIVRADA